MLEKVGLRPIPCEALPVIVAEPLVKPVREVLTVMVALLPGVIPVAVTNPPVLTVAFPEVDVAL